MKIRIKKLHNFLLLEVLIAMALSMILLSTLMAFYFEINRINLALEKEQNASFQNLLLSTRLAEVLPRTISGKDLLFYTSNVGVLGSGSSALTFLFDNDIKLDPNFSNNVVGRLYVNDSHQLCLAIWPSFTRWNDFEIPPVKQEILLSGVNHLSFEFYVPPHKNRKSILVNNKEIAAYKDNEFLKLNPLGEWKTEWQQEYQELPAIIKLKLNLIGNKEPIILMYPLPKSHLIIVYE